MGINNDGVTVTLNLTMEEFVQFEALVNIGGISKVFKIVDNYYKGIFNEKTFSRNNVSIWEQVKESRDRYNKFHAKKVKQ